MHAELAGRRTLDVAAVRKRHDHRVIRDEVLDGDLAFVRKDGTATWSAVFFADGAEFFLDDRKHAHFASNDVHEVDDLGEHVIVFAFDLIALHAGELIESQF